VLRITFRIKPNAPRGRAVINLRESVGETTTQLNEGGLDLNPDPSDVAGDVLDGAITVRPGRRPLPVRDLVFALSQKRPGLMLSDLVAGLSSRRRAR
jgi:hypothetical protein